MWRGWLGSRGSISTPSISKPRNVRLLHRQYQRLELDFYTVHFEAFKVRLLHRQYQSLELDFYTVHFEALKVRLLHRQYQRLELDFYIVNIKASEC